MSTDYKPVVLVVEDEFVISLFVEEALGDLGLKAQVFSEGRAALDAAAENSYAAALIDLGLPDISGEAIVANLLERGGTFPIIVASGLTALHVRQRFATPRVRVLSKPFDSDMLRAELESAGLIH